MAKAEPAHNPSPEFLRFPHETINLSRRHLRLLLAVKGRASLPARCSWPETYRERPLRAFFCAATAQVRTPAWRTHFTTAPSGRFEWRVSGAAEAGRLLRSRRHDCARSLLTAVAWAGLA